MSGQDVEKRLSDVEKEHHQLIPRIAHIEQGFVRLQKSQERQLESMTRLNESMIGLAATIEVMRDAQVTASQADERSKRLEQKVEDYNSLKETVADLVVKTSLAGQINKGLLIVASFFGPSAAAMLLYALFN